MKKYSLLNLFESMEIDERLGKQGQGILKDITSFENFKSLPTEFKNMFRDIQDVSVKTKKHIMVNKNPLNTAEEIFVALKNGSLSPKEMGRVEKGFLKGPSTSKAIRKSIASDWAKDPSVLKELEQVSDKSYNGIKTYIEGKGYNNSLDEMMTALQEQGVMTKEGKNSKFVWTSNPKPPVPPEVISPETKSLVDGLRGKKDIILNKLKELKTWKKLLKWGIIFAIPGVALWYFLGENVPEENLPEDYPDVPPKDLGEWAECIKELIKSGEGVVDTTVDGQVTVTVITDEYPKGIQFFSDGKVMDLSDNKTGTWKCKGGETVVAERKNLSLFDLIMEQDSEIDVDKMTKYVDDAVWHLDGYVDSGNLKGVLWVVKQLQGKTFQGKNAIQEFLSLYKEDEGGDDFVSDVKSVGVRTLGTKAILAKQEILNIVSGKNNGGGSPTTPPPTGEKVGLKNIEISWNTSGGGTGGGTGGGKLYHNCQGKGLPHEYGCYSEQIKQVQSCLKSKGSQIKVDGWFGPKTKSAIESYGVDASNGVTQGVIDKICGGPQQTTTAPPKVSRVDTVQTAGVSTTNVDNKPTGGTISQYENGKRLYKYLTDNKTIVQSGNRLKYKGDGLSQANLDGLNTYLKQGGYSFYKDAPKKYGEKYVWIKNQ